jgi:hypothetical protein
MTTSTYVTSNYAIGNSDSPSVALTHSSGTSIASVFILHCPYAPSVVTFDSSATGVALAHSEITQSSFRIYIYTKFGVLAGSHTWNATIGGAAWLCGCVQVNDANAVGLKTQYNSINSESWGLHLNIATTSLMVGGDTWEYGHGSHTVTAGTSMYNTTSSNQRGASGVYRQGVGGETTLSFSSGFTPVGACAIELYYDPTIVSTSLLSPMWFF